jgi:hypothetical protein
MSSTMALRYYLPKTVLDVNADVRFVVVYDSAGGHLEPRVDIRVTPRVAPDRSARCRTTLEAGVLEAGSLGVRLSPDGLIEAVGSHVPGCGAGSGPIAAPGRSSVGSSVRTLDEEAGQAAELARRSTWTRPGALRTAFNQAHPRTAALICDLSARAEQFLAGMRMGDGPAEVEEFGSALAVVERELAAADRMRREWIAAQGFDVRAGSWQVDLADVALLPGSELPATLPGDTLPGTTVGIATAGTTAGTTAGAGPATVLARDYGVLIALLDPDRPDAAGAPASGASGVETYARVDELLLRQPRPVTVAVYLRAPAGVGVPGTGPRTDGDWTRDDALTQYLDVVDGRSTLHAVGPEGHLTSDRALNVTFYPSGQVRTFGVSSSASAAVGAMHGLPGGTAGQADGAVPSRSDVAAAALEAARLQLALLQASDEFTRLAATHAHGGELATLEQDTRFAALRSRRG